ncbi:MAG: 50S ribosomal protein L32e [Methanocellales archaeon]
MSGNIEAETEESKTKESKSGESKGEESKPESKVAEPKPELSSEELRLLAVRKRLKAKKPEFRGPDSHKKKRVNPAWRRPTGLHHKVRSKIKAKGKAVKVGFRGPAMVRGLHPSGFEEVVVYSEKELDELDRSRQAIKISGRVGMKKRAAIIEKARSLGFKILNPTQAEGGEE